MKKKNIRKTSGTRKKYKPGQLITIGNCVFRITKNRCCLPDSYMCDLDLHQRREYCINHCILHSNVQDGLQGCYLKLVKHKG